MINIDDVSVDPKLRDFLIPLTTEEFNQLEANIVEHGCREPLLVWANNNGEYILVDGHNRYKICKKNDIPFEVKTLAFDNITQVKSFMIDNQMGRRNLTPDQLSYYRGLKYLRMKSGRGGVRTKGISAPVRDQLAEEFKVSSSTINRDSLFAEALELIGNSNLDLRNKILSGETDLKKSDIQIILNAENPEKLKFRNEADLFNKAHQIKQDALEKVETNLKEIENRKLKEAIQTLEVSEPAFLDEQDRLKKIKGKIISSMNRAIKDRDARALSELKELIETLEKLIFMDH